MSTRIVVAAALSTFFVGSAAALPHASAASALAPPASSASSASSCAGGPARQGDQPLDLCALGAEPFTLDAARSERKLTVRLPEATTNAAQDRHFYTFRLAARISLAEGDGAGALVVAANGKVVSQVNLKREAGKATAFYNGFATGPVRTPVDGGLAQIDYENYLQFDSLRGGANDITFLIEDYSGRKSFVTAEILPATRLVRTDIDPYQIGLALPSAPVRVTVGEKFSIPYQVTYKGQRGPRSAQVAVASSTDDGVSLTESRTKIESLGPAVPRTMEGTLHKGGSVQLRVAVSAGLNEPTGLVTLIGVEPGPERNPYNVALLALAPIPVFMLALWRRRRRRAQKAAP